VNPPLPLVDQIPLPVVEEPARMVAATFAQTVWSGPAFTIAGTLTTSVVVALLLVHPFTVTVTVYVPASAAVAPVIVLFCVEELKLFGPVHEYVAPATNVELIFTFDPWQTGPVLEAIGGFGVGLMVTTTVPGTLAQPLNAVTVYVPAAAAVAPGIVGFCNVEVNPFGPLHVYVAPGIVSQVS
jgi:hypothetical protein